MAGHELGGGSPGQLSHEMAGQLPPLPADQQAFIDRLGHARWPQPLPDLAEHTNHDGIVIDQTNLVADGKLNVNMAADVLQRFTDAGERARSFMFTPKPLGRFGKEKSYRGAFFGALDVEGSGGHTERLEVVVKQYALGGPQDAQHNAIQELTLLDYARRIGLNCVEPMGVIVDRLAVQPKIYMLMHRKEGLESMDELNWRGITRADMADRLRPAVDMLSLMHGNLLFHGDPKFKNIGLGEDGQPIVFDLEHGASVRDLVANMDEENGIESMDHITNLLAKDFSHLRVSLQSQIYPNLPDYERPSSPLEEFEFELTHLYEPYHMKLMEGNSPHKDVLNQAYNRMVQERRGIATRQQVAADEAARQDG